ncbi:hypothetical protein V8B97DRAFT_1876068 [Scleroderma yunnanense]
MSPSPAPEDDGNLQLFSILLTVCLKGKKIIHGKMTSKQEKSTKMKELLFTLDNTNHLEFLHGILKHGLQNYEVTYRRHFPLKYIPPKLKGYLFISLSCLCECQTNSPCKQWTSDMIDVDNLNNYRDMVKKISDDNPPVVKILVDM